MRPTRISALVTLAVVVGGIVYAFIDGVYTSLPVLPRYAPVTLFVLGAAEAAPAVSLRRRIRGGLRGLYNPLLVARLVALAKASALVGALAFGGYAAFAAYTFPKRDAPQPHRDFVTGVWGAIAALVLLAGALLLEYACRVPPSPDDEERSDRQVPAQRTEGS